MSDTQLYKAKLLEHFKQPRNKATSDLSQMQIVRRGSNPRCGDDIEVGFNIIKGIISPILFRGRGCSVCIAAASMMTEAVSGKQTHEAAELAENMRRWIAGEDAYIPESLMALDAVRHHKARQKCVMLAWHALTEGITQTSSAEMPEQVGRS